MPVTKISGSVTENLKRIEGQDEKLNTQAEAKALLEYMPRADVRSQEDYVRLYCAYQEAQKILNGRDANLGESLVKFCRNAIEKGSALFANLSSKWGKYIVSN